MLIKSRIRSLLCLGLILFSLESTAVAQLARYACGVDDQVTAESDDVAVVIRTIASEQADEASPVDRPRIRSRSAQQESAEDVLLKSAAAVRQKLQSERSRVPDARYRMMSGTPLPDEAPAVLDASVRNGKHRSLLPKLKPFKQLLSRGTAPADEEANIQQASHVEPIEQHAPAERRSTLLSRHMTPEELADYVKQRRSRPWWRRR